MTYFLFSLGLICLAIYVLLRRSKRASGSSSARYGSFEVFEILVPKIDDPNRVSSTSALSAENLFASLHGLLRDDSELQEYFSFELISVGVAGTKFIVTVPSTVSRFLESQLYAQYPTAQIRKVEDYTRNDLGNASFEVAHLTFLKRYFFPIKTFRDFESDPLSALTSSLGEVGPDEQLWFHILVKPIPDIWQKEGYSYVNGLRTGGSQQKDSSFAGSILGVIIKEAVAIFVGIFTSWYKSDSTYDSRFYSNKDRATPPPRLTPSQDLELKAIENKLTKMGFEVVIKIFSAAPNHDKVIGNIRSVVASLKQFSASSLNGFSFVLEENKALALENMRNRIFEPDKALILTVEELASVYHLPSSSIETPNLSWIYSRKSEPPTNLPTKDCTYIGETIFRSHKVKFGIANDDDRLRHMYLIGKSGTGKSTLLETMITQDIKNGYGVGVLDPHGETIDKVLERIPDERIEDVIYFDPSDDERPIGINLLEMDDPSQKNLMASALVSAIKHHFDYSWGPRLEYLLNYAILTLLEVPGTTMLGITRLLEDDNYRRYILHFVKDPVVQKFWEKEFKEMKGNQKLVTEAVAPIQNKVNRFLASTTIRNILGQRKSTLSIWDAMNSGKILLMNLSKGKIGSDNSNLLGALLVSRLQFMALQRAKIPYEQRNPFYLYVDEFQNFATGSFEEILSESRKYKLGLYLTHQFTAQLPEHLLKAVFGNVGTIATFSLGAPDARVLASEFAPYFEQNDIISLERFHVYIKLMINGMTSLPFSAKILVPWESEASMVPKTDNKQKVLNFSREKYGVDRSYIEERINKWVETPFDKGMAIAQEIKDRTKTPGTMSNDANNSLVNQNPL